MNKAVKHFLFVCRCLSYDKSPPALSALREDIGSGDVDWRDVVEIANRHFVTPALWVALRDKGLVQCLPRDLCDFLSEIHRLNVIRNGELRKEALIVAAGFNDAGIVPVMLKGGAHLFENAFGDPGTRMMRDLDILVPMDRFDESVAILDSLGFQTEQESDEWVETHSFPAVWRPGGVAPIELHKDVGPQRSVLEAEVALRDAVPVEADGHKLLVLSPTHQVIHNFFHGQIQDQFHGLGFISLKQLNDLLAIWDRHGNAVDWKAICKTMERQGWSTALTSYVHQANHLLDLPAQADVPPTLRAKLHFRRCLAQIRWKGLMSFFSFWAAATMPLKWSRINYNHDCGGKSYLINSYRILYLYNYFTSKRFDRNIGERIKNRRDVHYDFN